uniref:Platelet activating factor receptor n=1 Tax=Oreochromis niloticus TaxID=8128 RepID=A0A669DEA5_ORENI
QSSQSTTINLFLDSEFRYVLIPVSYIIFFILGLISNLYAMGEIHIYMTNLTIADLLFVCALPFWIDYYMREGDWVYGDFMCRVTGTFFSSTPTAPSWIPGLILKTLLSRKVRVKRRALQMLLAVVGVFVLCFLPHHVVQGPWVLAVLEIEDGFGHVNYNETTRQLLSDAHQITLVLMGLNCILDPVVYYFATGKFRGLIKARLISKPQRPGGRIKLLTLKGAQWSSHKVFSKYHLSSILIFPRQVGCTKRCNQLKAQMCA